MITVDVKGLKELQQALLRLPIEVQDRPLKSAVSAAAKIVQDEVHRRAPLGATGNLRKAVYRTRSRSRSAVGKETYIIGIRQGKAKYANTKFNRSKNRVGKTYKTQGEAYYWRFIEFGRPNQGVAARPFIRPAFEAKRTEAITKFSEKMKQAIERTAARLKR